MKNWKVGDKARIKYIRVNSVKNSEWRVGAIVEISIIGINHLANSILPYDCTVVFKGGSFATVLFDQLEPIIKRPLTGNWEDIEYITDGWNPSKEKVT